MRTNVLSEAAKRQIVRRAARGESLAALGREFGVSLEAISYHTRKVLGPREIRKVTPQMLTKMRRAWEQGQTAREIGARFEVAERTVAAHMKTLTCRSGRLNRKARFFPPADPVDVAYLAAMLDAEGCISRGSPTQWQVSITGSSPTLMDWLSQWGGTVYKMRRQPRTGSRSGLRKQVFVWKLTATWDIATMLDTVLPFMIEKQGRAATAVEEILSRHGPPPWAPEVRPVRD